MTKDTKPKNTKSAPRSNKSNNRSEKPNLAQKVLNILADESSQRFSFKSLLKRLKIRRPRGQAELTLLLEKMVAESTIIKVDDYSYRAAPPKLYTGTVDFASRDVAYIFSEELGQEARITNKNLKQALHGDTVSFRLIRSKGERPEGEVIEILERSRTDFVGRIEISPRYAFVVADNRRMHYDIFVPKSDIAGAERGDKVIVRMTGWDKTGKSPVGRVIKVLGKAGEHHTEMHAILAEFDLPLDFPEVVENEANSIPDEIPEKEIKKRRDMRSVTTFTIDPDDAKDFDDALSFQVLDNGNYEIGVHIADVTHYVQPNTELDREALNRGTSVYLVDRVVPMLPEKLSNGICSLRPHEDKLTFSAVFEMTPAGKVTERWFGRTVTRSDRRFSYEEAQVVLDTSEGDFVNELLTFNKLAHILRKKRFASGAIEFETVELKFKLDENGKPLELIPKIRVDAHKLIEEFMLLANKEVAEHIYKMKKGDKILTMVYRTHDAPNEQKLDSFVSFAAKFGYKLDTSEGKISASINELTHTLEGRPEQNLLQGLAVRAMSKAIYTTEPKGHFGLAFAHYTHFTSPIRRYPDMMAHRLIWHYLHKGESVNEKEWEKKCVSCSDTEKRAANAERASIKYKQVELIRDHVDEEFDGIVTGVTEWGMFVEMEENKCEGLIRMADMQDDFYELDEKNYCLVGRQSKRKFTLGDKVRVLVKGVNLERRQIDLMMASQSDKKGATVS